MPLPDDLEATAESQPLMEETPPQPQTRRVVGVASILLAVVLFAAAVRGLHAPNKVPAALVTGYIHCPDKRIDCEGCPNVHYPGLPGVTCRDEGVPGDLPICDQCPPGYKPQCPDGKSGVKKRCRRIN
mmetsp:Transcript_22672/g.67901  ORF Transcript_22672/g.67901 Transcript_22672/m.67901 type:complete len:128 (-) Transcript_22672:114-497(-)